jgi:hypothetical protein
MTLEAVGLDSANVNTRGGSNSFYCYGLSQGMAIVGNIMGAGDAFTSDDAGPWLWALIGMGSSMGNRWRVPMTLTEFANWQVETSDPGPGNWSGPW